MDLLKQIQKEIGELNLTDKLTIARYIYIRTGEMFDYNFAYFTYGDKNQDKMFNKKLKIHNIKTDSIICASWAHLYAKLLRTYGINANYVESNTYEHAFVIFYIDEQKYKADITNDLMDISKIKLGFQTEHFKRKKFFLELFLEKLNILNNNVNYNFLEIDKNIGYYKGIYSDEVLSMIKNEIISKCSNSRERIQECMEATQLIVNIERPNMPFASGFSLIQIIMDYLLDEFTYGFDYTELYDKKRKTFIGIIADYSGLDTQYYKYDANSDGYYKLKKCSLKKLKKLLKEYKVSDEQVLRLKK